jgi:hypothetical protein
MPTTNGKTTTSKWAAAVGQNAGYDPNKFYVQSSDARGHRSPLRVPIPPDLEREIRKILDTGAFPAYEILSDFVRDAVQHHIHTRTEQIGDPRIREAMNELFVQQEVKKRSDEMLQASTFWSTQFDQFSATFTTLARDQAWGRLWKYLGDSGELIDTAPEPYRSRLFRLFDEWRQLVPLSARS